MSRGLGASASHGGTTSEPATTERERRARALRALAGGPGPARRPQAQRAASPCVRPKPRDRFAGARLGDARVTPAHSRHARPPPPCSSGGPQRPEGTGDRDQGSQVMETSQGLSLQNPRGRDRARDPSTGGGWGGRRGRRTGGAHLGNGMGGDSSRDPAPLAWPDSILSHGH